MVLAFLLSSALLAAFGAAVGLAAGLLTLPFLASSRVRAAFEAGPTPEWVPNYLFVAAVAGTVEAFAYEWFDRLPFRPDPGAMGLASVYEQSIVVVGGSVALLGVVFLWARAREVQGPTGFIGASLCTAASAWFAIVTMCFLAY